MTSFLQQLDALHDSGCEVDKYLICPDDTWTTEDHALFQKCIDCGFLVEYDENKYGFDFDFEGDIPIKKYRDLEARASYNYN